jgi:hypothetical protein
MPTLIATVGAPNANAYITLDRALALLDAVPNASAFVDSSDSDAQLRDIIEATTELDVPRLERSAVEVASRASSLVATRLLRGSRWRWNVRAVHGRRHDWRCRLSR